MIRYFIKRILMLVPVILAVSLIIFCLMDLLPGDMLSSYDLSDYTEEEIAELRASLGLDDPLLVRYGRYMLRLIQGDLGVSDINKYRVWDSFMSRLPNTLYLTFCSFVIGVSIAIPMGVRAARRSGKITDTLTTAATMVGMSMPGFWLGILLILLFSYKLGWLPTGGFSEGLRSMIMPAIAASAGLIAACTRQTRSSMLEVLKADYLRTARAKGVPERVVIRKHALRNALIPIVTSLGLVLSGALAGSAIIETVFAFPGIGRFVVECVQSRDPTATTGSVIMTTIIYCIVQLLVDMAYAFIDPRIKVQYTRAGKSKRRAAKPAAAKVAELQPTPLHAKPASGEGASYTAVAYLDGGAAVQGMASPAQEDGLLTEQESESMESVAACVVYAAADTAYADDNIKAADASSDDAPADSHKRGQNDDMSAAAEKAWPSGELLTKKYKKRSLAIEVIHHMRRNPGAVAGFCIISIMIVLFFISLFIPFEAISATDIANRYRSPSLAYLFGTDNMGRNMLARVVYATRYSLPIGIGATTFAALIGIFLGSHAAYYGGIVDDFIMRMSDTLASIPGIIMGMVIVTVLGQSLINLIIAVGVASIPTFIRITRASMLTVKGNEFIEAARAIGLSNYRIMFTQALPNGLAPIMITFSITLGNAILVSAGLSYLGFGIPVPYPEWGSLVSAGRDAIRSAPWLTTIPGLFIMVTVMGFNLLGDGLRDALDPKLKK
ncbi:MAG: ABC transporter permease subunit [Clostridiales bacterium]|nr:ABC transporter permease subunit [Clostridiales bacterium]